jgi:hypothetical protein
MADELMGRRRWGTLLLVALCHLSIADAMPQHMKDAALGAHRQLLVKKGLTLPPTVWNTSDLTSFDLNALTRAQVAVPRRPLTPGAASPKLCRNAPGALVKRSGGSWLCCFGGQRCVNGAMPGRPAFKLHLEGFLVSAAVESENQASGRQCVR